MADPATVTKTPSPIGDALGQILDLINGARGQGDNRGATAAGLADPFASQRGGYQDLLRTALTTPGKFAGDDEKFAGDNEKFVNGKYDYGTYTESPGYKFARDQGLAGVSRAGNAMFGSTRSGNTAAELEKYATGFAAQDYDKWMQQNIQREGLFNNEQDAQRNAFTNDLSSRRSAFTTDLASRRNAFDASGNRNINALLQASGATSGNPAAAAQAYLTGNQANDKAVGNGLSGLDGLLGLLGQGGSALTSLLSQGGGALAKLLTGAFGDGGFDFSKLNLGAGDLNSFLTSIGIDPTQGNWIQGLDGILNTGLVQPGNVSLDLGNGIGGGGIDPSTTGLLGNLGITPDDLGGG